jgi:hypothetical protein
VSCVIEISMWPYCQSAFYNLFLFLIGYGWRYPWISLRVYIYPMDTILHNVLWVVSRSKDETFLPVDLLQPFLIPNQVWAEISMDFIEGLHPSHRYNVVMVVVDGWPLKYAHFIPISHPFTAAIVANNFMQKVFKFHGLFISIVSDMDAIFISSF